MVSGMNLREAPILSLWFSKVLFLGVVCFGATPKGIRSLLLTCTQELLLAILRDNMRMRRIKPVSVYLLYYPFLVPEFTWHIVIYIYLIPRILYGSLSTESMLLAQNGVTQGRESSMEVGQLPCIQKTKQDKV